MNMGRPRSIGNKDIPEGLFPPTGGVGCWRMAHPVTKLRRTLKTKDKKVAIQRYWKMMDYFESQIVDSIVYKDKTIAAQLITDYRLKILPRAINKKGKAVSSGTLTIYKNYLKNAEQSELFKTSISIFGDPDKGPETVRKYLAEYLEKPKTYNNRKSCLSRFFDHCIDLGHIQRNPCQPIKNKMTLEDTTYLPDDHYVEILEQLTIDTNHEVYARACDWIYLVSGRVENMLDVRERQIIDGEIHYYASKNEQPVIVERDDEILELVQWFRDYKREQRIFTQFLIVHPKTAPRGLATKPITGEQLYRRFKKAAVKVGYPQYHLRHLRAKALTDEAEIKGEATNKGAHKTERMRQLYVKRQLPVKVKSNIKRIK